MLKGIDVSSYQSVNYSTAGLSFVGIKVTQGVTYVNPNWTGQRATARKAGLVPIFYHYPNITNSPASEADHFLGQIKLEPGDVLCLDWEWYGQNVTNTQARAYKTAWLAYVKAKVPGHRVILYCDRSVWTGVDTDSNAGDGLWIADYVTAGQPRIQAKWLFHQYSDSPIDQDVANFATVADLKAWAGSAGGSGGGGSTTGAEIYPGASKTHWYSTAYPGDPMQVNTIVWHSTETTVLPDYSGGSIAPTLTAVPNWSAQRLDWYQHFGFDESARALVHAAGQMATNTLNVAQVEIVGTCDPTTHAAWAKAGTQHLYMPELPDWAVRDLHAFAQWAHDQHGVPLTSGLTWLPYPASYGDNGVRMNDVQWGAFRGHCGHQHVPQNCVHPDTPILCADLTWRRAGDLEVGDEIVSFDEETIRVGNANGGRKYRKGAVTRNDPGTKESYRVVTTDGEVIATADHPWLVRRTYVQHGSRIAWVQSKDLKPGKHRIISIGQPWEPEDTRIAGWLAGILDADGHAFAGGRHGSHVGFGQVDGEVLDLFLAECDRRGWMTKVVRRDWTQRRSISERPKDFTDVRILGGMWESCRVLGTLRPERLLPVAARMWEGSVVGKTTGDVEVLRAESVGVQPIASISTSTHTYIANGLLCHNTHGDPGQFPIAAVLKPAPSPAPAPHYLAMEDDDMTPFPIPPAVDVDIPVEPAGTAQAPQGGAKNAGIWLGFAPQGADGKVTVTLHQNGKWAKPVDNATTVAGGKFTVALPTDGSVDKVRIRSTVPLLGYVTGRKVA